jgi:hypothetical protein
MDMAMPTSEGKGVKHVYQISHKGDPWRKRQAIICMNIHQYLTAREGMRHALQVRTQPVPKGIMYVLGLFRPTLIPIEDQAGHINPCYDFPFFLLYFI